MRTAWLSALTLTSLLFGCAQESAPPSDAGESAAESAAVAEADLEALLATADLKRGQTLFLQCRACHSLKAGEPNKVGPNLYGMFGRKAGLAPGFAYSPALTDADVIWTPEALDAWLLRPSEFLPGNRMVFIGVKKAADRANLIAYLQKATSDNSE
jgi:cytochrome c